MPLYTFIKKNHNN